MYVSPIRTPENAAQWAACDKMGVELACVPARNRREIMGVCGKTFAVKDQLKAAGFKFDGQNKIWLAYDETAFNRL